MTTKVINLKGRLHEYGLRLERASKHVVHVGRRLTRGGRDLSQHPLYNPFQIDTPKKKHGGTREEVMASYRDHLMGRPDLLTQAPGCAARPSRAGARPSCATRTSWRRPRTGGSSPPVTAVS